MILKKSQYTMKNGYIIQTITGKDSKGIYFFIGVYSENHTLVEKFYFRNSTAANNKYMECRNKYRDLEKNCDSLESPLPADYNLNNSKLSLEKGGVVENAAHEIRSNARTIPEGVPTGSICGFSSSGHSQQPPAGSPAKSGNASGISDQASDQNRRCDGNHESNGSASMDWHDEQHQGISGRDSHARTDLHLNTKIKKGDSVVKETVPPFLCEKLLTALLCCDRFLKAKRSDVIQYFKTHTTADERSKYMCQIYNDDFTELIVLDQQRVGYKKSESGLFMWEGSFLKRTAEAHFSWDLVQAYVSDMIQKKVYLPAAAKATAEKVMPEQLSLFEVNTSGTPMKPAAGSAVPVSVSLPISAETIRTILRTGGNSRNSRTRIYAQYRIGKNPDYMISFLKNEYGQTGKGFIFNKIKIAVWFDDMGMHVAYGDSASHTSTTILAWEKIEKFIRSMVESGDYMCADEIAAIDEIEHNRISNMVMTFFRDMICEFPSELTDFPKYSWPDGIAYFMNMLSTFDGTKQLLQLIDSDLKRLHSGVIKQRFRMIYSPEDVYEAVADLLLEQQVYPIKDSVPVKEIDFITQDEIDTVLLRGSGFSDGSKRIYDYFQEGHNKEENIAFLKKEYGIGGHSHALPCCDDAWEEHDFKGIQLLKGDITSPTVKVLLKWPAVEKRIRELVRNGRYYFGTGNVAKATVVKDAQEKNPDLPAVSGQTKTTNTVTDTEALAPVKQPDSIALQTIQDTEEDHVQDVLSELLQDMAPEETTDQAQYSQEEKHELPKTADLINFHWSGDLENMGKSFSPKEKFRQNIDAIKTLQLIESENRFATPAEQEILANYVGWGGLADAFDPNKTSWSNEYLELKGLLSAKEYTSARESVLTAYFTSPVIVKYIYEALNNFGFKKGNILDPSLGIGNFFSMLPESMQESKLYGVELDSITGRIAKQLYPLADIKICGFEETDYPNDFFDIAISNVPFGDYKVSDRVYDKHNFLIHDFFFAKTIDKVRPGGIIAFVTSKGTMDKQNTAVRKYIAARAELLGAVRLPNTAFKANANTEVTSDILFLKKRDRQIIEEPDWVQLEKTADGIEINRYFAAFPEMILGNMEMVSGPYGMQATCSPSQDYPLSDLLSRAIRRIKGKIDEVELDESVSDQADESIPADPNVKNYSFTLVDDKLYYRENSVMTPVKVSQTTEQRIKGMLQLRDCTYQLIDYQLEEYTDAAIAEKQAELNRLYDAFTNKYGLITSQGNKRAFIQDSSYFMLSSLEILDDDGNFIGKADMFHKRTIKKPRVFTTADTSEDALKISLCEKAKIDLPYMAQLTGKSEETIIEDLSGIIFLNPITEKWEPADEYLSGNVANKLAIAKSYAGSDSKYRVNVTALEQVQPKKLDASEIEIRLGATWIEPKYIEDFIRDTFKTSDAYLGQVIKVLYSELSGAWRITKKGSDLANPIPNKIYGTNRLNGYELLERCLNLREAKVYDYIEQENGKPKAVLNKAETMLAVTKQENIKEAFKEWVFQDQERRQALCDKYNALFNTRRPRTFDGSHLQFHGMSPDIELKPHQKNAVARILYGNNTLLAHCVGAGKTFEMAAAAMEMKYLGLCNKPMFVVPNHLTEQWTSEFLRLYPGANILATRQNDFKKDNRKKFCSKIATGDYDAIIIGHSQFEKLPISAERQVALIEKQIDELEMAILDAERNNCEHFTVKQMESMKKKLVERLNRLNESSKKDDVITFEQLGVDHLFVDESHNYKNLFLYTKMNNVAGISHTEAKKSSDMFAKCQYLDDVICCEL